MEYLNKFYHPNPKTHCVSAAKCPIYAKYMRTLQNLIDTGEYLLLWEELSETLYDVKATIVKNIPNADGQNTPTMFKVHNWHSYRNLDTGKTHNYYILTIK